MAPRRPTACGKAPRAWSGPCRRRRRTTPSARRRCSATATSRTATSTTKGRDRSHGPRRPPQRRRGRAPRRRAPDRAGGGGGRVAGVPGFHPQRGAGVVSTPADKPRKRGLGTAKMVGVAIAAFAFTFSLVPLYRVACEKVFGIRVENGAIGSDRVAALGAAKSDRVITVQFDGGVNSKLPWSFHPDQVSMKVRPGEQYDTTFYARNDGKRAIVGNAVPSIAPARASG